MPKPIVIQAPSQGIAQSAHVGFEDVRNLDLDSIPGIAKLSNVMAKKSGTVIDAQVKWIARDPVTPAEIRALDSNGVLYESSNSGADWTQLDDGAGAGQGLIINWGYAFVFKDTTIDVFKISDDSETPDWQTIGTDSDWHPTLISKNDGKIYFGCGRYIGSIEQVDGQTFDPASSATYTVTLGTAASNSLDLPDNYKAKCLEELGNNLMIGTWQGTAINSIRKADIFPWDRSAVSFGQPISLDEFGVHSMINTGNSLTVLAGIDGGVYRCNGASAWQIAQLPQDLAGGKYIEYYPDSMMNYKQKVYFGTGIVTSAGLLAGMGVYSIQSSKKTILNLEHLISTLRDGSANEVQCTSLLPITRDTFLLGWRDDDDATGFGIDLTIADGYYDGANPYSGYFDTPIYELGNSQNKYKPISLEVHLGRPLVTGEGIKVEYRTSLAGTFATVKTLTFTNQKGFTSNTITTELPTNIKQCEQLQLRISLLGTATPNGTTPRFKYAILK